MDSKKGAKAKKSGTKTAKKKVRFEEMTTIWHYNPYSYRDSEVDDLSSNMCSMEISSSGKKKERKPLKKSQGDIYCAAGSKCDICRRLNKPKSSHADRPKKEKINEAKKEDNKK